MRLLTAPGVQGSRRRVVPPGQYRRRHISAATLSFKIKGENPAFSACGSSKFLKEPRVHVSYRRRCYYTIPDRARNSRSALVEGEIFHQSVAIGETAGLPSRGMAALDHKERDSGRVVSTGIE